MPSGSHKITGATVDPNVYESENKIEDEEIKKLLAAPVNPGKKKKKASADKAKGESTTKLNPQATNGETEC